jgi:hypothetical protein
MSESQTTEPPVVTAPVVEPPKLSKTERVTKPVIHDNEDYMMELRRENEKLRKTLEEQTTTKAEELSNQKLEALRTETEEKATAKAEKLVEKKLAELEEASKARLVKAELRAHAMKANVIDFDDLFDVLKRADLSKIEFSEDGDVKNAADIITDLKQRKPHLFAGVNTASTERAPVTRENTTDAKSAVLTMNKADYEKAKRALGRM